MNPKASPTRMAGWLESAWIARYIDRELDRDEATWFEAYVLDKPDLLAMIEADTYLRDALAADPISVRQGFAESSDEPQREAPRSDRSYARKIRSVEWMGMAASLVLGVGIGYVGQRSTIATPDVESVIANPTQVSYDPTRGPTGEPVAQHSESLTRYVLLEFAVPIEADAERASLEFDGVTEGTLKPSRDGFVSLLVPRSMFERSELATLHYWVDGKETSVIIALHKKQGTIEP